MFVAGAVPDAVKQEQLVAVRHSPATQRTAAPYEQSVESHLPLPSV